MHREAFVQKRTRSDHLFIRQRAILLKVFTSLSRTHERLSSYFLTQAEKTEAQGERERDAHLK